MEILRDEPLPDHHVIEFSGNFTEDEFSVLLDYCDETLFEPNLIKLREVRNPNFQIRSQSRNYVGMFNHVFQAVMTPQERVIMKLTIGI